MLEKDVVLDVALRLGMLIEERMGAEVVYTRRDDSSVALEQRTALANEEQADLFLSIHANAGASSVSGSETYYLSFSNAKADLDVAARENAVLNGVVNVDFFARDVRPLLKFPPHPTLDAARHDDAERPALVMADPPRAGLARRALQRAAALGAEL